MSNTHFLPKSLFEYLLADDDYLEKENYLFYYRLRLIIIHRPAFFGDSNSDFKLRLAYNTILSAQLLYHFW
jgi:hypothetical protein